MSLLSLRDVEKSFTAPDGQRTPILSVPAFTMESGEELALLGGSGTGKTTLLHLIAGLLRADRGAVELDGEDLSKLSEAARDRHRARVLGYVHQGFNLLQGFSALENVLLGMVFGNGGDRERATKLLEQLGLGDRLGYRPGQLSVGQQQRVAVARALAGRPKLVLADEPTGNLDARNAKEALELLRSCCREEGAALLVVSHDEGLMSELPQRVRIEELNRVGAAS